MKEKGQIIKYTIVPRNDNDDYDSNFRLSLTEFAKSLDGKALLAPLILYNSDLDIPMDMDDSLEEYMVYTDKDNILDVIRRQELTDVFRSLVVHGFDISLDEVRDVYCPLARRNQADICINTIQDLELDNNLTFYLYDDLDQCPEEEWQETKDNLRQDMKDYIDEYKAIEEMDDDDLFDLLPLFFEDETIQSFKKIMEPKEDKKKEEQKESSKKDVDLPTPIPLFDTVDITNLSVPEKEERPKMITVSYECDGYIALNKVDDDLYTIEDDDYEVLMSADQIDFIVQAYNRIKDKPVK